MQKIYLAILAAALFLVVGCSKITEENYDKIRTGMSYEEIVGILGSSDSCDSGMGTKNCLWGDANSHIQVKFIADKVVLFSKKGI
jgi:hypothetical protein